MATCFGVKTPSPCSKITSKDTTLYSNHPSSRGVATSPWISEGKRGGGGGGGSVIIVVVGDM